MGGLLRAVKNYFFIFLVPCALNKGVNNEWSRLGLVKE